MRFVGRQAELQLLADIQNRPGAQFLLLYGRRRVGKTSLIHHWLSQGDRPHLYWTATQTSAENQLRAFSQALFHQLNPGLTPAPTFSYAAWDAALVEAGRLAAAQPFVLVLDEFTYVLQANGEAASLVQRAWDLDLARQEGLMLVLTGSLAGVIERALLAYQAPLYGRATARLRLQPLPFGALGDWFPGYSAADRLALYAITGGVPAYLNQFDPARRLADNLATRIVSPANVMLTDAIFLLQEQLDEPRNYIAIIEAIAAGYHRLGDISRMAGLDRSNVSKYLSVLRELGYVRRDVPVTVRRPERSRQGRYVLTDAYLRFYYRFLAPHGGFIERGLTRPTLSLIEDQLDAFIGRHSFEELSREWVALAADRGELPFLPDRIGRHWSRQSEVDVVAVNWRAGQILLGECKWSRRPLPPAVVDALVAKSGGVLPTGRRWQVHYAFFARNGFQAGARQAAETHGARLLTRHRMEADLRRWLAPPAGLPGVGAIRKLPGNGV